MGEKRYNMVQKLSYLLIFIFLILFSCKGEEDTVPPIIIKPSTTEYLKFDFNSANQLSISEKEKNAYLITTTGTDPYIFTKGISKALHPDSVVLTFEYKSAGNIDPIQIFFGPQIREDRSLFGEPLASSSTWKSYSINLKKKIKTFSWGKVNDFLRFDFGTKSGLKIDIRNIHFRSMNTLEKDLYDKEEAQIKKDEMTQGLLSTYLDKQYPSSITEVKVGLSQVTISGVLSGEGKFSLCEIFPEDTLVTLSTFKNKIAIDNPSFQVTVARSISRSDITYDRLLSKWVIVKESGSSETIDSHARYADVIEARQSMSPGILKSKKGLGGFFMNSYSSDLDQLGITSITINIPITAMMYSYSASNTIEHTYGNKKYYFSRDYLNGLDQALRFASSKKIIVAAILLVQKASESADPVIGKILQHPSYTSEGIYTMPNLTTAEGVNCYAAALDFLASRYNRTDDVNGRIHKWILHNEVDAGLTWTNMGRKPMLVYLDTYVKSLRICYNIARQYDVNSEVMGSFTHSWSESVELYSSKEMLKALQRFSVREGDFQWGIAYHPYPQDLNEPKTWNDTKATFSMNSALVTFKNLEVIDYWVKQSDNRYKGTIKRSLWLSENGTNSRTYENKDLMEQAAGFAYAWKKISVLDGIDAIQWHNWIDNRVEYGLRIGLRKFPDDATDPAGRKPVWYAYQAAGTDQEDNVFEPYKSIIGISSWSEIMQSIAP
ncbi:MAG: DUF5722 domain-containing protein [Dysgonamonadaceae bacterium]|nr:DUF5722 domain-containing protein [Dysgonamonadaceae bacterium]